MNKPPEKKPPEPARSQSNNSPSRIVGWLIAVVTGIALNFLPPGSFGQVAAQEKQAKLKLVCSTTQIADFTRNVVGDLCDVESILGPGQDPHIHEVTVANARLVAEADICFQNGWNLEGHGWMEKLCRDAGKPLVTCVDGVTPRKLDDHGKSVNDPHAWFSINNGAKIYVRNIYRAMAKHDPAHEPAYRKNAVQYIRKLDELDSWVRKQVAKLGPGRVLATHHDAFGYFARDYDFKIVSLAKWSTAELGGGTSQEKRNELIQTIRQNGIRAVFTESSLNPEVMKVIARETGAKVGGKLYSDAMGPRGSGAETYIGMMKYNVETIVRALKK